MKEDSAEEILNRLKDFVNREMQEMLSSDIATCLIKLDKGICNPHSCNNCEIKNNLVDYYENATACEWDKVRNLAQNKYVKIRQNEILKNQKKQEEEKKQQTKEDGVNCKAAMLTIFISIVLGILLVLGSGVL